MLTSLWRAFFSICCFRSVPQELPASRELLAFCMCGYGFGSFLLTLSTQPVVTALLSGLVDATLLGCINYALLALWGKPERWLQSTTALAGTGIIFSIVAIPLSFLLANTGATDPVRLILFLFVISLLVWNIGVMAHIIRHALSTRFAMGVLVALFYIWAITVAVNALFPVPPPL